MMEIKNVVIHQVKKKRHSDSKLNLRKDTLVINTPVEQLVVDVKDLYTNRTGKTYGSFQKEKDSYPFQKFVREYIDNPAVFMDFTVKSMNHLKILIDKEGLATGGYVLFVHYKEKSINYVMVLMLYDKIGSAIDPNTLDVQSTIHLDLEKLHFVSRLNVESWGLKKDKYITFIKGKRRTADDVSKYFINFIGCTHITTSKDASKKLLKAVAGFVKKKAFSYDDSMAFKHKIYDFCTEKRKEGKPVLIESLSSYLDDENPKEFMQFANSEEYGLDESFDTDPSELRKLKRYFYRSKDLNISFSDELLGRRIIPDYDNDELVLKGIPESLKSQLREANQEN